MEIVRGVIWANTTSTAVTARNSSIGINNGNTGASFEKPLLVRKQGIPEFLRCVARNGRLDSEAQILVKRNRPVLSETDEKTSNQHVRHQDNSKI